jgi:hypothetical protein
MNTGGHEDVALDAGYPLLRSVFGSNSRDLPAFYLGNWITDVSQFVDPVGYARFGSTVSESIETVIVNLSNAVDWALGSMFTDGVILTPHADKLKKRLTESVRAFSSTIPTQNALQLSSFVWSGFLIQAYFKFVHPRHYGAKPQMDFATFMKVFGRVHNPRVTQANVTMRERPGSFTQYFPHEHLDRPEMKWPGNTSVVYAPGPQFPKMPFRRAATAPPPGPRSWKEPGRITPDLYSYLRNDIEMVAGLLSDVDIEFKRILSSGRRSDPKLAPTLAMLGHALHQVEDFFAHSNWVELAAIRLGPEYQCSKLPSTEAKTKFALRRQRLVTEPKGVDNKPEDEDWVVTGYADRRDLLISLSHWAEEQLGLLLPDPFAEAHKTSQTVEKLYKEPTRIEEHVQRFIRETLDCLTTPKQAFGDRENRVARVLTARYGSMARRLLRSRVRDAPSEALAREIAETVMRDPALLGKPWLKISEKEVHDAVLDVIVLGTKAYAGVTLYRSVKDIAEFVSHPKEWILRLLPDFLKSKLVDAVIHMTLEQFHAALGAKRIGSHSLLAKDHGNEPLYPVQKDCATAVHWYIVLTLLRWTEEKDNTIGPQPTYIDWLHLLEHFLQNPLPPDAGSFSSVRTLIGVSRVHIARDGDQLQHNSNPSRSLVDLYRGEALHSERFTWKTIADANFGTRDVENIEETRRIVNQTLRDSGLGYPVRSGNYAFKEGIRIVIPQQREEVISRIPPKEDTTWFELVMRSEDGWRSLLREKKNKTSVMAEFYEPKPVTKTVVDARITRGKKLRREARQAYARLASVAQ